MADLKKKLSENVDGDFFVDSTCIDCDACRQIAPATFGELNEGYSFVYAQPQNAAEIQAAARALVACPVGSIGKLDKSGIREATLEFPTAISENVFYCGFNSERSFGANSFFVRHPEGNWLVDSPKFHPHLVKRFEAMGGVKHLFLTHRDDVADAHRYAQRFGSTRIIHITEKSAQPDAELFLEGTEPIELAPEFMAIPTPGHTRGHSVLLYKNKFLFTGDHLHWNRNKLQLGAFRNACWYSWPEQTASMARLLNFQFEYVLAGHGDRIFLPASQMYTELAALVDRMKATR